MTTVEEFYDDMCKEFLNKYMTRYINMESFRTDFINEIYKLIELTRETFTKYNVTRINDLNMDAYYEYLDKKPKISLCFNQMGKTSAMTDNYYYCLNKFVEAMANKR